MRPAVHRRPPVVARPAALPVTLLTALVLAVVVGLLATPAAADDESVGHISRMDVTAAFAADGGTGRVELDFTYDFGDDEAHGPFLVFAERQEIAGDPDRYRMMEIDSISAESSSGAPDDLRLERDSGAVQLYIGDEDVEVTGEHDYRVEYTIDGLLNPGVRGPDGTVRDELYWNVVSPGGFDIEIRDVTVGVTGPVPAEATACYLGRSGSGVACDDAGETGAGTATFSQEHLDGGEGLSVVVGWPEGTFTGAEPEYEPRRTWANTMQLDPVTGGVAGLMTVLGVGGAVVVASRRGRDRAYLDTTAGVAPVGATRVGRARKGQPIAVRSTPPDDVRPGEIGTLHDEVADHRDVTATLVDLAVRGYLRIEEVAPDEAGDEARDGAEDEVGDGEITDWRLVPLRDWSGQLEAYEAVLLDRIFAGSRKPVALSDVAETYAGAVGETQEALYRTVTEHGWFRGNPSQVRTRWVVTGVVLLVLGLVLTGALVLLRWPAILGLPIALTGLAVAFAASTAPARTPSGTVVLAQTLGFRDYLARAQADQIRVEESQQIFSRYLPYAIAFGLTDHWAEVFAELTARSEPVTDFGWYVPLAVSHGWWARPAAFSASIGAFTEAATSAVTAASSGSGGGSGFSGSVGGGAGGTGGGSW